jgi:glycosyltransferase involved in cell wall biosynthesis
MRGPGSPEVSVAVITRNRAGRLADLLVTLRSQTIGRDRFEVIVVDDGSSDETPALLRDEDARGELDLRILRRSGPPSRAAARNEGWTHARASLMAYIDDDCIAAPDWLEQGLRAASSSPGAIVQGFVDPIPAESAALSPATRTQRIHQAGPYYQTCNIFYPRALIEELGGFDERAFTAHGGEDTDLAWRAITRGASTAFAQEARVYHAVNRIGLLGRLRFAGHWSESMLVYKRYPELRRAVFTKRIFWKPWHYALFRVLIAVLLPRRLWFLRPYLVIPYVRSIEARCRFERGNIAHALFYPLEDLVEIGAMARASLRHRMLVL